jgi:ribonuclease D
MQLQPTWVAGAAETAALAGRARRAGRVAIDTEADSLHSYFHKVCLIQLSFGGTHALIDPLAVGRAGLAPVAELLADPAVTKLFHGADYDLRVLDRDLGARAVNVRDTQVAAQLLGLPQTGLASLLAAELDVTLDKGHQRADWGQRPLPPELIAYAAADTAYLEALEPRLARKLAELGRLAWWEEECAALEAICWEPPVADELAFEKVKGAGRLRGAARDRLAALHRWREERAAAADTPPFRVLRGEAMLLLAGEPPADLAALAKVPGVGSGAARRIGADLLRVLAAPPAAPERVPRARPVVDKEREARVKELRAVRDAAAVELGLDAGVLAPRAALEAVVDRRPADPDALADCLGRRWRAAALAPVLLPAVAAWSAGGTGGNAVAH